MNVPPRQTNTAAVISLACGIGSWIALPFILAIAAVIAGHMARGQLRREPGQDGEGMALTGLILGYANIVFTVLAVIAIVLFFVVLAGAAH
jgi:hypothetical protein